MFMEQNNKFSQLYRVQSTSKRSTLSISKNYPIKRVIINGLGKVVFDADAGNYIYFSRTDKHHCYYIFNKVLKIINEEITNAKKLKLIDKDYIPDDYKLFNHYYNVNIEIIKKVKEFFNHYIPEAKLELVTINYLNGFSKFIDKCALINAKKGYKTFCPEISDTRTFGGAYGISDAWLELLNCCTVSTSTTCMHMDKFFDFLIDNAYRCKVNKRSLTSVMKANGMLFEIMNEFTSSQLNNPQFFDKKNINKMYKLIDEIKYKKLYNPSANIDNKFFEETKRELKEEILQAREL